MHIVEKAYKIIPVYTADVSGVCSALYELGGMVVMHDPSGCNSTYNTHDETRWYEQDSLIYISGLTEIDAVMGNDRKFIDDIKDAAQRLQPAFIAVCGSPIPFLNGTDFQAIARICEKETGIPSFAVETNGTRTYLYGAGLALRKLGEKLLEVIRKEADSVETIEAVEVESKCDISCNETESGSSRHVINVNVIGLTPLDFAGEGTVDSLKNLLGEAGMEVRSTWAMGDTLETLKEAVKLACNDTSDRSFSCVNLVVSAVGMDAAKWMESEFGIPYVVGTPIGSFAEPVIRALRETAETGISKILCNKSCFDLEDDSRDDSRDDSLPENIKSFDESVSLSRKDVVRVAVLGEPVVMGSIARDLELREGVSVQVLCPMDGCEEFLGEQDAVLQGEYGVEEYLKNRKMDVLIADPLYAPVCPENCRLIPLPHLAFSGRCAWEGIPNLFATHIDLQKAKR